jgi:hypothetical protein
VTILSYLRYAISETHDGKSSAGELGEDRGSEDGSVTIVCDSEPMVIWVCTFAGEGNVMAEFFDDWG